MSSRRNVRKEGWQARLEEQIKGNSLMDANELDQIKLLALKFYTINCPAAMIAYLEKYVRYDYDSTKLKEMKSMWCGCYFVPNKDYEVCWVNTYIMHNITGYPKTSIEGYFEKLHFQESVDQVSDKDRLKELIDEYNLDKHQGVWVKYERLPEIKFIANPEDIPNLE